MVATACNFVHEARELYVTVHGDDFIVVGPQASLQWFEASLKGIYEIKSEFLGPQEEGCQQVARSGGPPQAGNMSRISDTLI